MKALLLSIALVLPAAGGRAATLTLHQYTGALERLGALLTAGDVDTAHAEASALQGSEFDSSAGRCRTDGPLLSAVATAKRGDIMIIARIDSTVDALRAAQAQQFRRVDPALLARLARDEAPDQLRRGGGVAGSDPDVSPLVDRWAAKIKAALEWIGEKIGKLMDWLAKFWPEDHKKDAPSSGMHWIVGGIVALIVIILAVLAFEVLRRARARATPVQESAPVGSGRDDDPLSRGANEWERYAAQLAEAGRFREAIRAWYHAVLVTLYATGILQVRKGRTNWEYVAALAPQVPWRGTFIELTRHFEEEWYGSDASSEEALTECAGRARRILTAARRAKDVA
ncbi:MAG: DUF4129 domain-containing protein [Acidobacteriota bacterium]